MSRVADPDAIIGINWSSTRFRAYLIAADGALIDTYVEPSGVAGLARERMIEIVAALVQRWPGTRQIYAAGMIGSAMGWTDVGYAEAPSGAAEIARLATRTVIRLNDQQAVVFALRAGIWLKADAGVARGLAQPVAQLLV